MNPSVAFFVDRFRELAATAPVAGRACRPRPYRNAAVRFRDCAVEEFDRRCQLLDEAGLNVFSFPAAALPGCDLLSDSGTTTMTMQQWAAMMLGDEAYGSNEGWYELKERFTQTFGPDWQDLYLFHQGRAAEHALATCLRAELERTGPDAATARQLVAGIKGELGDNVRRHTDRYPGRFLIIPSNAHFDTTEGNFDANGIAPLNLPCAEHRAGDESHPFRGNIDTARLDELLAAARPLVPVVYLTVTNNTGGGQPVSLENIRAVRAVCDRHGLPFFLDACRFAENAWFIKQREPGYEQVSVVQIVREMFDCCDGFHISLKKDGLANIGGALALKPRPGRFERAHPGIGAALTAHQIMVEGHPTYGGLAGRDLRAIAEGLRQVLDERYLAHRVGQVQRFGERLAGLGVPVIRPIGGSAVYIEMDRFFGTTDRDAEFPGIGFTALLLVAGHRLCELGIYAFGRQADGRETPPSPRVNNVRAAVPRLAYEDEDLAACAEAIRLLHRHRDRIPGVTVEYGQDQPMRHFKSRFRFLDR
jgi:tryptophanase